MSTATQTIRERLADLSYLAQREMPVVGTPEHPTPWDLAHADIDAALDQLAIEETR